MSRGKNDARIASLDRYFRLKADRLRRETRDAEKAEIIFRRLESLKGRSLGFAFDSEIFSREMMKLAEQSVRYDRCYNDLEEIKGEPLSEASAAIQSVLLLLDRHADREESAMEAVLRIYGGKNLEQESVLTLKAKLVAVSTAFSAASEELGFVKQDTRRNRYREDLVRLCIAAYANISGASFPQSLEIGEGRGGKPEFTSDPAQFVHLLMDVLSAEISASEVKTAIRNIRRINQGA